MRLLVAGDCHGNVPHFIYLVDQALEQNCEAIVAVGDFGYTWPGKDKILPKINEYLETANLDLYWLDGNHDNYTDLKERGIWGADEPQQMASRITYLPRASTWEWDGVTFMAMGGAISIDKDRRISGSSWWPEESLSYAQIDKAIGKGQADVMFTHDCPAGVAALEGFLDDYSKYMGLPYKTEEASTKHREALGGVTAAVKPRLLVHGHYHHRYNGIAPWSDDGRIIGLDRDTTGSDSWLVLDTAGWDGTGQSLVAVP